MHSCQTVNCDIIDMSIYRIYYDVMVYAYLESSVGFVVFKLPRVCKSVQSHVSVNSEQVDCERC